MVEERIRDTINDIVLNILVARNVNVSKIVIYGSFARGTETADSDIDVLIISPSFRGQGIFQRVKEATGIGWALVETLHMPFDLLYYSDAEWDADSSLIIREAKREGEVIYEAPAAP